MQSCVQYDLFENMNDPLFCLNKELEQIRQASSNVRKGIFARHNELAKLYLEQREKALMLEEKTADLEKKLAFIERNCIK